MMMTQNYLLIKLNVFIQSVDNIDNENMILNFVYLLY